MIYELDFNNKNFKEENINFYNEKIILKKKFENNNNETNKNFSVGVEEKNAMEGRLKILENQINNLNKENNLFYKNNQRNENDLVRLINNTNIIENKSIKKKENMLDYKIIIINIKIIVCIKNK